MTRSSRANDAARRTGTPWGGLVLLTALGVRAGYLLEIKGTDVFALLTGDAQAYHEWGERIASGQWLGHDVFFQAPLYPYFLGVVYRVAGPSPSVIRVIQLVLGSIACWLLYRGGRRFFSPLAGALAGLLLAIYPTCVFFDGLIQKSALDLVFMTALVCFVGRLVSAPARYDWLATGAIIGGFALTRENALVVAPVLTGWLWLYFRSVPAAERLAWTGWLVLGVALVLVPVGIRNRVAGGEFVLTTAQLGPNLYIGNNPRATGRYMPLQGGHGNAADERLEATKLAERATGRPLTAREVSRYWAHEALAWIATEPGAWLRLMGKKWLLLWNAEEVTDTEDQGTYTEYSVLLGVLTRLFHFGVLLPLAVAGIVLTIRERSRLAVLYALGGTFALSTTVFFVVARYRLLLVPLLVLFAAAGMCELVAALRSRQWARVAIAGCAAIVAAVFSNWPIITPGSQRAPTHYNLGLARAANGDLDGAGRYFEEAVRLDPNLGVAWGNLGVVFGMKGDLANAERCFREALAREPDLAETHGNLGNLLDASGRRDEAIAHYREAVRLRPWGAGLETTLGLALLDAGRLEEASQHLNAALAADGSDRAAHYGLGVAMAAQGQRDPALTHLRRARTLAVEAHDESLQHAIDEQATALGEGPLAGEQPTGP